MQLLTQQKPPLSRKDKVIRFVILLMVVMLLLGIYFLVNLVLRYWFLSIGAMIGGLIYLAYMVGTALMFPGAFAYFRGSIEMNYSQEMSKSTHTNLMIIQKACESVVSGRPDETLRHYPNAQKNVDWIIGLLGKFKNENTLSERKQRLLALYRQLQEHLTTADGDFLSVHSHLTQLRRIGTASKQRAQQAIHCINHIREIYKQFFPALSGIKQLIYQHKEEKLFEIRYGLYTYDQHYNYQHKILKTTDKCQIEYIVIENFVGRDPPAGKPTVLFCNPNGAHMQLIAMECKYIDFYLEQGYCVCLWNYRGYGQSTGTPSLSKNEVDVLDLYEALTSDGYSLKISHGYSIGGPVAIYVACVRSMNMLIADRTFGSIDLLAKDYGSVFFRIMKVIFYKQRRDYTQLYLKTRCRKLIICDPYDQVIHNTASLKHGVAQQVVAMLGPELSATSQPYLTLNEQSTNLFLKLGVMFKRVPQDKEAFLNRDFIHAFLLNTMPFLVRMNNPTRRSPEDAEPLDESISTTEIVEYLSKEASQSLKVEADIEPASNFLSQEVAAILQRLDSAGMENPSNDIKYVKNHNLTSLLRETEAYLNGLIVFGSYYPYKRKYRDPSATRHDTVVHPTNIQLKIYAVAQDLAKLEQETKSQPHARAIGGIRHQLSRIGLYLHQNLQSEMYEQVGLLLPTRAGHNGQLSLHQYQILGQLVSDMRE